MAVSKNTLKKIIGDLESGIHLMSEAEKNKALEFIDENKKILARDDFYVFLRMIAPEVIPPPFFTGRHLFVFCNELEKLERAVLSKNKEKIQLFLPPGSMKSLTLCLFVAWIYGRHPDWYVLHIGHTAKFAEDNFGQKIRDIFGLSTYREIFPDTQLSRHTRAKGSWKTTAGGTYQCTGVGNAIAGKRAHISICDDVLSEQTAISKVEREKINKWYVPGLRTRLLPTGCEVIVNTRWHLADLSGYIIDLDEKTKQKPWKIIKIPAILEGPDGEEAAKLLKLPVGGSFWPEFWPLNRLLEMKAGNTPQMWNALYMQNPIQADGNIFKGHHLKHWNVFESGGRPLPDFSYVIISLDTAFSEKQSADYSAFGVWGIIEDEDKKISGMMRIAGGRGRWAYPKLKERILELYSEWRARYIVVEKKASGQSILSDLVLEGLPMMAYSPDGRGDKEERANACVPFLEAGLVWINDNDPTTTEFIDELLQFPAGPHDDYVDSFTQAVLWMRDNMQLRLQSYGTIRPNYDDDDEDDDKTPPRVNSYWKATIRSR